MAVCEAVARSIGVRSAAEKRAGEHCDTGEQRLERGDRAGAHASARRDIERVLAQALDALEQIKADVAYTNANVKLVGQSPGVGYGELGPTHHSIEDMAWLRLLPNLAVVAPSDPWETAQAVEAAAAHEGPVFLRITRFGVPKLPRPDNARFEIGKAETLREGGDVAIIACGVMVARALEAADRLADSGVSARVVNMASIAPLDEAAIRAAADLGAIVTVEEHSSARRSRRRGRGGRRRLSAMPDPHPRFSRVHANRISKVSFRKVRADVGGHREGGA